MSFQLFRGTNEQVAGYNGADGEIVYNMTNKSIHVFDGVTAGGYELKNAETMKQEILSGATEAYDTLKEIEDYINANQGDISSLLTSMSTKADKPASPTGAAEALSWNGSAFESKNIGVERRVNGADIEFVFG